MNIDLKLNKLSAQIRNRIGKDIKRILEIQATARDVSRDLEETGKIPSHASGQELEVVKEIGQLKQPESKNVDHHHPAGDEREHSDSEELTRKKKREKGNKDPSRQSELKQPRRAATLPVEMANHLNSGLNSLKKAEGDEILVELRRKTAAAGRRSIPRSRSSSPTSYSHHGSYFPLSMPNYYGTYGYGYGYGAPIVVGTSQESSS